MPFDIFIPGRVQPPPDPTVASGTGRFAAKESLLVLALCLLALVRLFVFSAAYPLFVPIDELQHFDTAVKQATGEIYDRAAIDRRGYVPRIGEYAARMRVLFESPEYQRTVDKTAEPAFRSLTEQEAARKAAEIINYTPNHEIDSPPLYYFVAGQWLNLGSSLFSIALLPYWMRFMNLVSYGLLVWLAYRFGRKYFPDNATIRLGLPMLLSVFPNDVFFSMNSDTLSPLFGLLALLGLFHLTETERPVWYVLAGLAVAGAMLVKLTNLPILVFAIGYVLFLICRKETAGRKRVRPVNGLLLAAAVFVPLAVLVWWNLTALHDITGTASKLNAMGITKKPFAEWFRHPLFNPAEFGLVISNFNYLMHTFWRGEIVWGGKHPSPAIADVFYVVSSVILVAAGVAQAFIGGEKRTSVGKAMTIGLASILLLYLGYLGALSIQFDFWNSHNPSRENPFFNMGRLVLGGLIPFLVLYLAGLEAIVRKLMPKVNPLHLVGLLCLLLISFSLISTKDIFASHWNWFHLIR